MACIRKTLAFSVLFLALYNIFPLAKADACYSDFSCKSSIFPKYCCERKYPEDNVCKYSCVGESCILHSDCAPNEYCCGSNDRCATSCVGKSCTYSGDCADDDFVDLGGIYRQNSAASRQPYYYISLLTGLHWPLKFDITTVIMI